MGAGVKGKCYGMTVPLASNSGVRIVILNGIVLGGSFLVGGKINVLTKRFRLACPPSALCHRKVHHLGRSWCLTLDWAASRTLRA